MGPTDKLAESIEKAQEILADHESGASGASAEEVVDDLSDLLVSDSMIAAVREALGDTHGDSLRDTLQSLYEAEINVDVASFYDSGWTVRIGDEKNGYRAEKTFDGQDALVEIAPWLEAEAAQLYPGLTLRRRSSPPGASGLRSAV